MHRQIDERTVVNGVNEIVREIEKLPFAVAFGKGRNLVEGDVIDGQCRLFTVDHL